MSKDYFTTCRKWIHRIYL